MPRITVFSDLTCPFCYVAERGPLAELVRTTGVELDWRGFEVHPEIPRGGAAASDVFGPDKADAGREYVIELAERFGVTLRFPDHIPNSMRALAMTEWARAHGKLEPLKDLLFDMFWQDGADLEDDAVLKSAAVKVGLCPARALSACEMGEWELRVVQNRTMGYGLGVSGVPTFISPSDRVVGCQPVEILQRLAR